MNVGRRRNTPLHVHTKQQDAHVHAQEKAGVPSIRLQTGDLEGEICPVMAVNEGCGGAVTLCLAGTQELRGAEGMDTVYRYNELGRWLEHGQILSQLEGLYC